MKTTVKFNDPSEVERKIVRHRSALGPQGWARRVVVGTLTTTLDDGRILHENIVFEVEPLDSILTRLDQSVVKPKGK
jgi:hypothetical protein